MPFLQEKFHMALLLPCHKCEGGKKAHYLWECLSSSLETCLLTFLLPENCVHWKHPILFSTSCRDIFGETETASLACPQLPCQLSSASFPVFPELHYLYKIIKPGRGLYLNRCAGGTSDANSQSFLFGHHSSRAMQIRGHSASLHCSDTVKWFKPGSHEQLNFTSEVPTVFIEGDTVCLFVCTQAGDM